jgi:hypothetical protein
MAGLGLNVKLRLDRRLRRKLRLRCKCRHGFQLSSLLGCLLGFEVSLLLSFTILQLSFTILQLK